MDNGYEQRNTGVFLSAMQQFDSITLEAAARNMITRILAIMLRGKPVLRGSLSMVTGLLVHMARLIKAPTMSQIHSEKYGNPDLSLKRVNSGRRL